MSYRRATTFLLAFLLALLPLVVVPTATVSADEYTWVEEVSKQGPEGFVFCYGETTYAGHHVTIGHNVGPDIGQPQASERAWQISHCKMLVTETSQGVFRYKTDSNGQPWNIVLPASEVRFSYKWNSP